MGSTRACSSEQRRHQPARPTLVRRGCSSVSCQGSDLFISVVKPVAAIVLNHHVVVGRRERGVRAMPIPRRTPTSTTIDRQIGTTLPPHTYRRYTPGKGSTNLARSFTAWTRLSRVACRLPEPPPVPGRAQAHCQQCHVHATRRPERVAWMPSESTIVLVSKSSNGTPGAPQSRNQGHDRAEAASVLWIRWRR